ncbi:cytochrome P450 [Streptomyces turgidiscabies]|uniref:Unspecific monooxygenase n=1 Tax=Streptomyces turgidiscabies (strain Car8) TaxID=698760 RepID=L7EW78_STRT8|nr:MULTISPECIES: cytochrome P450 [Streptomyces]ELP62635.1 unspecific monooxygenase [Streptomyces turgidiscabies Car8]MDX3494948.1 cytochrome P450 [Streptomyces turgidiscabies]GAQ70821.1 cytochrome P450 116 [Streptomyces turgidiscabies]
MDRQLHDRLDELQSDPYPHYTRAHAAEGLTFVAELDAWLVARDADVREVLRRDQDFSSAGALRPDVMPAPAALAVLGGGFGGRPVVVGADGTRHQELRAPIVKGLSPARVAAVVPYAAERAAALVDAFVNGDPDEGGEHLRGHVELMSAYARRLPGEVIGGIVGLDPADVSAVVHGGYRAEELLFRPLPEDEQIAVAQDVVATQHILDRYARARHAEPREDLCTEIVASVTVTVPGDSEAGDDSPELTLDQRHEAVSHLQNLLIAGHLTTSALIGTTVLHLLRHPAQWELLCTEPDRIPAAVEEAARYDTALQGFRRVTTRPVTLAGTELPAGATLFVAFGAANRDGARHPHADEFDITRSPVRHLAFGLGAHACPGSQLAREQLRLTLEELTSRLPGLRLAGDRPVTMRPTMIHRSPRSLHLTW